ncbi:MAG: PDZ domain-containing protein [Pirellulales bacterium]
MHAAEFHVATTGNDANSGVASQPFATLARAQRSARQANGGVVVVHAGTYYLPETLVFTSEDSGTEYRAAEGEKVVISGGSRLDLKWEPYKEGIVQAKTPVGLTFDQLFINGQRQVMARYPNYDPKVRPFGGFAADAFSKERAARWIDPAGGFIHAMHGAHWGGFHYRITGKNHKGEVAYEGGWQNNRRSEIHPQHRYVENIFEELDAPGEWFHNARTGTLYYFPPKSVNVKTETVEVVRLSHLVEFNGAKEKPVRNVTLRGFVFRHGARTFMDVKEPLLRSDWTIYRGGAVLFNGAEDCTLADCEFDQLGGNAVFVNNYNRRVTVRGCDIHDTGASAVAFVGSPKAVRNPLFEYGQRQSIHQIDQTPGPQTDDYPAECLVEECLLRRFGVVEKQATGVELSMAMNVTVRHCSIYEASRAGINISEGTFGGHVIEFCDVFDTVLETGDHGSFNSWGRDRYWGLQEAPVAELPKLALLDVVKPNILRNNRWRCDHGWDVDLDDGSSNYEIYNNLFLKGGLKLREGFHRRVWNNIAVNNSLHPHVWYENSGDEVTRNIWMGAYRPAIMKAAKWGTEIDRNLFTTTDADRKKFAANGCDANSLVGDAIFVDPAKGDYRVKHGSPALQLGFVNFPMDQFGVTLPRLKALARTPEFPTLEIPANGKEVRQPHKHYWLQAQVKNLEGEEFSAFGVSKESGGIALVEVPSDSPASQYGFQRGDLIQSIDAMPVRNFSELMQRQYQSSTVPMTVGIVRGQKPRTVKVASFVVVTSEAKFVASAAASPIREIASRPATRNDPLAVLTDGKLGTGYGPVFGNGVREGIYRADLGSLRHIGSVGTWSHNLDGKRGSQRFVLFGSAADDPGWNVRDRTRFTPIAEVDTRRTSIGNDHGTLIRNLSGQPLGTFRWLVWVVQPVTDIMENTAFQEFQVNIKE